MNISRLEICVSQVDYNYKRTNNDEYACLANIWI